MVDQKSLSFTATLMLSDCPLTTLDSITTGPIVLSNPIDGQGLGIDGSGAIGMFNCSDEDWQLGTDTGLITFDKGPSALPLLLYFRHFDEGYRLYVRSGKHSGEGVFANDNGVINVQPIKASDPCLWKVLNAQTGQPFDLTQCDGPDYDIKLVSAKGHPVEAQYIYPVGAFLASYPTAHQGNLGLVVQERGVDWLNVQ